MFLLGEKQFERKNTDPFLPPTLYSLFCYLSRSFAILLNGNNKTDALKIISAFL